MFHYRYSSWEERKVGGLVWVRTFAGEYARPISLGAEERPARNSIWPRPERLIRPGLWRSSPALQAVPSERWLVRRL